MELTQTGRHEEYEVFNVRGCHFLVSFLLKLASSGAAICETQLGLEEFRQGFQDVSFAFEAAQT